MLKTEQFSRTEQAEIRMTRSRLECMGGREGNPMGCEIREFGSTTAFAVKNIPGPSYNTVKGFYIEDLMHLDDILAFYREKEIEPRFELTPVHTDRELFLALAKKGYGQTGFHTSLEGSVSKQQNTPVNIDIRAFGKDEFYLYADLYAEAFEMPPFTVRGIEENNRVLYTEPGWHFYLAVCKGKPTGIAALYITGETAVLAASGTRPAFRRLGCHTALIEARRKTAAEAGCTMLAGQATFGEGSFRNMHRAGMQTVYTKAVWEHL
ncbi:GNAT family N-acetyltransferase [Alteribacter lacisalsi]|uniref:GNAT family N-acetyltransferase n=1 Tax=Alteribacter lacisalsi TaxID=2045244 RepID=A0A2W0HII0_9BACI|nr:GNAT family N-acetyltransferase [Alteribacter lacisalsi]PYZ96782.1 GNAT family N-acetyltransferase [Alteribacter lacisalsi]